LRYFKLVIICLFFGCLDGGGIVSPDEFNLSFISKEVIVLNDSTITVQLVVSGRTQAGYFVDVESRNMGMIFPRMIFIATEPETFIKFNLPIKILPNRIIGKIFNDFQPLDSRKRFLIIDLMVFASYEQVS